MPFRSIVLAPLLKDHATKKLQRLVGNHNNLDRRICLVFVSFFSVHIYSCPERSSVGTFACAFGVPVAPFHNILLVLRGLNRATKIYFCVKTNGQKYGSKIYEIISKEIKPEKETKILTLRPKI